MIIIISTCNDVLNYNIYVVQVQVLLCVVSL